MSELHDSELYQAATNALASDASSENTWTKMVTASFPYYEKNSFLKELKIIEKLVKEEYKISTMPTAWRSAKSVVLNCLGLGIALQDENGTIKGKSLLQKAIKDSKPEVTKNILESFTTYIDWMSKNLSGLEKTDKKLVKAGLQKLLEEC